MRRLPLETKINWENIDGYHHRLKVPFGWVFKVSELCSTPMLDQNPSWEYEWRISTCFIFDPFHWWKIK